MWEELGRVSVVVWKGKFILWGVSIFQFRLCGCLMSHWAPMREAHALRSPSWGHKELAFLALEGYIFLLVPELSFNRSPQGEKLRLMLPLPWAVSHRS